MIKKNSKMQLKIHKMEVQVHEEVQVPTEDVPTEAND